MSLRQLKKPHCIAVGDKGSVLALYKVRQQNQLDAVA